MKLNTVILSNFRKIHTKLNQTVHRNVLFLENCHFSNTVPNIVFSKIFNMFDRIKLIKHYIIFDKT